MKIFFVTHCEDYIFENECEQSWRFLKNKLYGKVMEFLKIASIENFQLYRTFYADIYHFATLDQRNSRVHASLYNTAS